MSNTGQEQSSHFSFSNEDQSSYSYGDESNLPQPKPYTSYSDELAEYSNFGPMASTPKFWKNRSLRDYDQPDPLTPIERNNEGCGYFDSYSQCPSTPGCNDSTLLEPLDAATEVQRLECSTFRQVINSNEVALVMFYNNSKTASVEDQDWLKYQIMSASEITDRDSHVYAAVDCREQRDLCKQEKVTIFPLLRLYSKGAFMKSISDFKHYDYMKLKDLVENMGI